MGRKRTADVMEIDEEEALEAVADEEVFGDEASDEPPPRKVYKSTENLRVDLSQEEILAASREIARAVDELHDFEQQRKAAAEMYKAKIAQANAQVQVNSVLVRNGYEFRKVDVERTFDYEEGIVTAIRLDTGEVFESRTMTRDERQMTCF